MSWENIKNTPSHELLGLMKGLSEYNILHSFDGYTESDVTEMSRNKPEIRQQYADFKRAKNKYSGKKERIQSFKELIN